MPKKSGTRTKILAVPCPKRYSVNGVHNLCTNMKWSIYLYQHSKAEWNQWYRIRLFTPCRIQTNQTSVPYLFSTIFKWFSHRNCVDRIGQPNRYCFMPSSFRTGIVYCTRGLTVSIQDRSKGNHCVGWGWRGLIESDCWGLQTRVTIGGSTATLPKRFKYMVF